MAAGVHRIYFYCNHQNKKFTPFDDSGYKATNKCAEDEWLSGAGWTALWTRNRSATSSAPCLANVDLSSAEDAPSDES